MFQLRTKADMSQFRLGELTGTHWTAWSKFESGAATRPATHHLIMFCQALGLGDDVLLTLQALREVPFEPYDSRTAAGRRRLEQWKMRKEGKPVTNPAPSPGPNTPDTPKPKNLG